MEAGLTEQPYTPPQPVQQQEKYEPIVVLDHWHNGTWDDPASTRDVILSHHFTPWSQVTAENIPQEARNAAGSMHLMASPTENQPVFVWIPNDGLEEDYRYFCHGHTLGTFNTASKTGYSVCMNCVHTVLNDPELFQRVIKERPGTELHVPNNVEVKAGDIVAWWELDTSAPPNVDINCKHTALVVTPQVAGGQLAGASMMDTKNGMWPRQLMTFGDLQAKYAAQTVLGVYRRRWPSEAEPPPGEYTTAEFKEYLVDLLSHRS